MPTNRTKRTRKVKPSSIPDNLKFYFETGTTDAEIFMLTCSESKTLSEWERCRKESLADWLREHPCSRPWMWWKNDAPRWTRKFEGCIWDQQLPEPRRRVGGRGTPAYESLSYVPHFAFGIPTAWVQKSDIAYHKNLKDFDSKPAVAYDPNNAPSYEAQASYLERHGLLTPTEKKWLAGHPEALEPETVEEA
jgi:hypothetical protein